MEDIWKLSNISLIKEQKLNPNAKKIKYIYRNRKMALIRASQNGHFEIVKYLIDKGANIESRDRYSFKYLFRNGYKLIPKSKPHLFQMFILNV